MIKYLINKVLPILILFLTVFSVQQWTSIPISNQLLSWIVDFAILSIILCFIWFSRKKHLIANIDRCLLATYFIWFGISSLRGCFIAENYWEWKMLVTGILSLSIPIYIYLFSSVQVSRIVLSVWFKYALICLIPLLPFFQGYPLVFYLGPVFVIGCFLPYLPKKWRYIIGGLLLLMLVIDLSNRSQVIKAAAVLLMSIVVLFRGYIKDWIIKTFHWACYIIPIVLLTMGLTGIFNIFTDLSSHEGKYVEEKVVDGEVVEEDLASDTRTFIYIEVINSALRHDYVWTGRTPARGNDSEFFGAYNAEDLGTGKYERHANELCHLNVFTWLGLIGLFLYSLIYLRSSFLAVYRSNSISMQILGVFIAFRWAYGWVEDVNNFDIANLALWMMIAMGLSKQFRSMTNTEFKQWVRSIFGFHYSKTKALPPYKFRQQ